MAWRIEYDAGAARDLSKLDKQSARRIIKFLGQRVAKLDDPRSIGAALRGSKLGDFWKYRVGDYRIVAEIQDKVLCIYVVTIGDRKEIYR
ncbi:MAG: type II toxin-antitoxin system RelE/ParE family toxin [Terracidiphilus sp.]|jgi:mRNA interferase RelE/StbE